MLQLPGKRLKKTRLVRTERFIVAVDVDAVILDADPSEPVYEPQTVELLKQIEQHAQAGDREWLMQHGRVYERVEAA